MKYQSYSQEIAAAWAHALTTEALGYHLIRYANDPRTFTRDSRDALLREAGNRLVALAAAGVLELGEVKA